MDNTPVKIFVGMDYKENVAYHTLTNSIIRKSSHPVSITALTLKSIPSYNRPRDPKQSNEFSFTRFYVPWLCNYSGMAIYMDCDMLVRDGVDIIDICKSIDPMMSVSVCKHDYTPKGETKFLGTHQYQYPCKNWSSLMVFNCANYHSKRLDPEYINTAPAMDLHQFKWTNRIGELPKEWNWLVGEYEAVPSAKIAHFTLGGPYFKGNEDCDYASEWFEEYRNMTHCEQLVRP